MKQVSSPDIQGLDYDVLLDISGTAPSVTFTNQSLASAPNNLQWAFEVYSPLGTPIYQGGFSPADVNGVWNTPFVRNTGFPRPFNQIEWSGTPYRVAVKVKDSSGKIFTYEKLIRVCRPSGNTAESKNLFGKAVPKLVTKCNISSLLVEDKTNYNYGGVSGEMVSKLFRLSFPMDETGNRPAPVDLTNFNVGLLKVSQSSDGYEYFFRAVYQYNQGNRISVRVKYTAQERFAVRCNVDLTPIACELQKLTEQFQNGSCRDAKEAQRTLDIVSAKLHIATIAILHPQAGIDPYKLVAEINEITGWDCNCCPTGLNGQGALLEQTGVLYDVIEEGGDVEGYVDTSIPGTVLIKLKDFSYVSRVSPLSTSAGLTIDSSVLSRTKYFDFTINPNVLADEILTIYENNTTFINRLQALLTQYISGTGLNVNINKKCLPIGGNSGESYAYTFTGKSAPNNVLIKYLTVETPTGPRPFVIGKLFDGTNLQSLLDRLNEVLPEATWTGSVTTSGQNRLLVISSTNNKYDIVDFVGQYDVDGLDLYSFEMKKKRSSTTIYPVQDVLQGIIDYVCESIINALTAGVGLTILQLQAIQGAINEIAISPDRPLTFLLQQLVLSYNGLVRIVQAIKPTNCETIKGIFSTEDTNGLENTDRFLMQIDGNCMVVSPLNVAKKIMQLATVNQEVKTLFCTAVSACAKGVCAPITNMTATYNPTNQTLTVVISNTGATKYALSYYVLSRGRSTLSGIETINATNGATTTYVYQSVLPGQYQVFAVPICADGSQGDTASAQTANCLPMESYNVLLNGAGNQFEFRWGGVSSGAAKVIFSITYPNGGRNTVSFLPSASQPQTMAVPAGQTGDFTFIGRVACDNDGRWLSSDGDPVTVNVPAPDSCPLITKFEIIAIGETSVTVRVTKPSTGTAPNAYTLRYKNVVSGSVLSTSKNESGGTVTFSVAGLTQDTEYDLEVISQCANGSSTPYYGGRVRTNRDAAANSSIENEGTTNATSTAILIDGVVVHATGALNAGLSSSFPLANHPASQVKVVICGADAQNCTVTSNGATYFADTSSANGTFYFSNVVVTNGMQVNFSN